jgi:hypothetical protein
MRITTAAPNELITEYLSARAERDQAQARLDDLQDRLIKQMEADQRKSWRWDAEGVRHNLTYVQSHTTVINEAGLRRALTAKVYDRYTKRVLDRRAMEAAMAAGEVDKVTVSPFVELRPNKPYLTYKEGASE